MSDYHYDRFSADAYNLDRFSGPGLGQKAPDAEVTTTDGKTRRLLDFTGDFLVLELGSITCPLFQSRRKGMSELVQRYPDTDFAVLYIREAHPGINLTQHKDFDSKQAMAVKLEAEDHETRPILIDNIEGTTHEAYGSYPNSVFIINRNGCVVYRSDWNNPGATAKALSRLYAGKPAGAEGMFLPAKPPIALATLKRAGRDAVTDFFKSLPVLIWKNIIKRNLRVLLTGKSDVSPDHAC